MDEINERRKKKNGDYTSRQLAEDLLREVKAGTVKGVVVVVQNEDGTADTYFSDIYTIQALGLLAVGTNQLIEYSKE